MTPFDAAGLALLGLRDRPLAAAILRVISGRATAEDQDAFPLRSPDEPLLDWLRRCRVPVLHSNPKIRADELQRIRNEAEQQLVQGRALGAQPVPLGDARYPARLASIADPPPLLWVRGAAAAVSRPGVALVGSRAATPYALQIAQRLAMELAARGLVVVSGLARGVDAAAHAATVRARKSTVAVLGCGIDRIYPHEHRDLAREIEECGGAVVSEFPPGVPPLPHHFPMRNRIISGLSLGVVVVEAPEKSGALITAAAAAEQGRDVLVVPGPASGGRNRGGHLLIRDGAKVVETADDIVEELNLPGGTDTSLEVGQLPETVEFTLDEVVAATGDLPNVVLARLLELELAGKIQRVGGCRFLRVLS